MSLGDVVTAQSLVQQAVTYISQAKSAYDALALSEIQTSLDKLEQTYNSSSHANTLYSSLRQNEDFLGCLGVLVAELERNPAVQHNNLSAELLDVLQNFTRMVEELARANKAAVTLVRKVVNPRQFIVTKYILAGNWLQKLKEKLDEVDLNRNRIKLQWPLLAPLVERPLPAQQDISLPWMDESQLKDEAQLRQILRRGYKLQNNLAQILPRLRHEVAQTTSLEDTEERFDTHLSKAKDYVKAGTFPRLKARITGLNIIIKNINKMPSVNPKIDVLDPEDRTISLETLDRLESVVKDQLRKIAVQNSPCVAVLQDVDDFLAESCPQQVADSETKELGYSALNLEDLAVKKQADLDLCVKNVQLVYEEYMMTKRNN